MKRYSIGIVMIVAFVVGGSVMSAHAQGAAKDDTRLTIPWDEFKRLVNLDDDDIVMSLETLQKLLAQTGTKTTPTHVLKDGNVVMTRDEFNKLVNRMKPPVDAVPPFAHLITKAMYAATMGAGSTDVTAVFNVHVLTKNGYVKVPILPRQVALADMRVDGEPALVVVENGFHSVVLPEAGEYEVTATYSVKSSLDKGPHKIDLAIQPTPITLLSLELPMEDIDVQIPQAQQVLTKTRGKNTVVSAVIGEGTAISILWRKQVAVADRVPAKVYAEVHQLLSIQDDARKTYTAIHYNILHNEIDSVRLVIPDNMNILGVAGDGVGEWQETTQQGQRILVVPFTYGKKGATMVAITTESNYSESLLANAFSGIRTIDTVRETGFIGIELATGAEVIVAENDGLETVVVQKLPAELVNRSARPLIMAFKYLKHPYSLVFDIKRHEKIAVPVATINSASVVTLFTEDGKIVHRVVYDIRNSAKQFLEIQVPEKADVWSVFVGNQPVESSMNGKGKLLVPLIRSRSVDNRLDTFPVEVIYCMVQDKFAPFGTRQSALPAVDLLISQILWSVYLPNDYAYHYFESTLEKEEIIRGVNVFSNVRREYDADKMRELRVGQAERPDQQVGKDELKKAYKGNDYLSRFRNIPMEEAQLSSQMDAELEFGGRLEGLASNEPQAPPSGAVSTGVLPIQIRVPTSGQVYRFAKTIIRPEDELSFSVVYTRGWVMGAVKWIGIAFIGLVGYWNRRKFLRLGRWGAEQIIAIARWIKQREGAIKRYARSAATPFVLFGLGVILRNVSGVLALLAFFLLWIALVYHGLRLWRKRAELRTAPKAPASEPGQS